MKTLFIINAAPYGSEYAFNALRIAGTLIDRPNNDVKIFLIGDGASCAKSGQKLPEGMYNIEAMLVKVLRASPNGVGICTTCLAARGILESELIPGARKSGMAELADWTEWADKVLVF